MQNYNTLVRRQIKKMSYVYAMIKLVYSLRLGILMQEQL